MTAASAGAGAGDGGADGVITVGALTREISALLGEAFPRVTVVGQVSNARLQRSGHLYFSLKDDDAQLGCAMWRSSVGRLNFRPEDGQEVLARGRIEVYPPHGKYQLIVSAMRPLGLGELHLRFEALKRQLGEEGLFEPGRKRPLPLVPRRVAIITSPTSAALRDMLRIALRRYPRAHVTVFPCRVQGDAAPGEIAAAIQSVPSVGEFDVVIAGRGGGSIEDLWAFNEEVVARAIAASTVPVVSAVGHETDTTIADLVADARAATPSEAAEIVFPIAAELEERLRDGRSRLERAVTQRMTDARRQLDALARSYPLQRPVERMHQVRQQLDEWETRAADAIRRRLERSREELSRVAAHLEAVSPVAVLARGYSITTIEGERAPVRDAAAIAPGTRIETRLDRGRVVSEVLSTQPDPTQLDGFQPSGPQPDDGASP